MSRRLPITSWPSWRTARTITSRSTDVRLLRERDEHNNLCEWVELDNLHLDGLPARNSDVDFLFEGGLERLEEWVLHEEQALREDQVFNRKWRLE